MTGAGRCGRARRTQRTESTVPRSRAYRTRRSALLCALCTASLLSACDRAGSGVAAPRRAFQVPCAYPRDPIDLNRFGAPCLIPPAPRSSGGFPCAIDRYAHNDPEARSNTLLEYDEQGRVVGENSEPMGRARRYVRYAYEEHPNALTVKRAAWVCGQEPSFSSSTTYRFNTDGYLVAVEDEQASFSLSYEKSHDLFGGTTNVLVTGGGRIWSFELNRRGEIESRIEQSSATLATMDYDHEDGRVSRVTERDGKGRLAHETSIVYDGERPKSVVIKTFSEGRYMLEEDRFKYECSFFPVCAQPAEGVTGSARTASPKPIPGEPAAAASVALRPANPDGVAWAQEVRKRVDGVRRSAGKPMLHWNDTLSMVAQRDADDRSRGISKFDPMSMRLLGYNVAVRVERLGALPNAPVASDLEGFSLSEIWEAHARREVGLGIARVGDGQPDVGKLALVIVSADRPAPKNY